MTSRLDLAAVIAERTLSHHDMAGLKHSVAAYMLEENIAPDLDSLMRDVLNYRAKYGHVEATVVSAYPLTELVRKDVMTAIKSEYPLAKNIILNQRVDPDVVGGLRIELVNEELDLTVQAKLNKFKRLTAARKD